MGSSIENKTLNKERLLEIMTDNLPALRAKIGLSKMRSVILLAFQDRLIAPSRLTNEKWHGIHLCRCFSCFGTTKKQKC